MWCEAPYRAAEKVLYCSGSRAEKRRSTSSSPLADLVDQNSWSMLLLV
jgi:hypothetical protein